MLVNKTIRFSSVDGPGNRFVVFVQGCNFNCIACHNPYTIDLCDSCGGCVATCPEDSLSISSSGLVVLDQTSCTSCDACIDICPINSTPLATEIDTQSMLNRLAEVAPFISGITISGGEATQQADAVFELFSAIKESPTLGHLSTFIDSNGSASRSTWDLLAPVTDGVMLDLKAFDRSTHLQMTGHENAPVLDSILYLDQMGLLYEVRLLMVPGVNNDPERVRATAEWLHTINPNLRIKVIGFRRHGVRPEHHDLIEPCQEELDEVGAIIERAGLPVPLVI